MPLTTPAMPTVSSGRSHRLPLSDRPAAAVRSISREFVGLDVAVRPAGANEGAQIGRYLLFEIHADPAAALILAHGGDIGWTAGDLRQCNRIFVGPHAAAGEKPGHRDLAGMAP